MDEIKAAEIMKLQIEKVDSITAQLYEIGIKAIEDKNNKKSINEQKQELYDRMCSEICKYTQNVTTKAEWLDVVDNICPNCPLYELTK